MKQRRPGQWQRNNNRPPLNETTANIPPPKPPIPANAQAKSKLKAFQSIPGYPGQKEGSENNSKEHEPQSHQSNSEQVQPETVEAQVSVAAGNSSVPVPCQPQSETPQLPHANTFPCTPGTRLPLEALISNFDDNATAAPTTEPSPEEHIGWIPNSSSNLLTPSRKRKRARGSSPSCPNTSSQRQSVFFAGPAELGEQVTPENDPTAALWQRYAVGKQSGESNQSPALDQLMFQVSSKKLETPAKSAGLRRWASAGNNWPTSKTKRRRTQAMTSINIQDQSVLDSAGRSKVAEMVEKLQETLASQQLANPQSKESVDGDAPSSSSPLPETGATEVARTVAAISPLTSKKPHGVVAPTTCMNLPKPACDLPKTSAPQQQRPANAAHVETESKQQQAVAPGIDATIPAPLHLQNKGPLPAYRRPTMTRVPSTGRQYPQRAQPPANPPPPVASEFDEFGDDLDLSAADLEELMTQTSRTNQRPVQQMQAQPNLLLPKQADAKPALANGTGAAGQSLEPIVIEDDEFGLDDLDETTLAQVESRATQSYRASHPMSRPIGRSM
jgi:DNA replication ATP-dependent helicase Dna2